MYVCTYVLCNSAVFTEMPRLSDKGGGGDIFERHLRICTCKLKVAPINRAVDYTIGWLTKAASQPLFRAVP